MIFKTVLLVGSLSVVACKTAATDCIDVTKIQTDVVCTLQYDPVCGCDGKTYGNACTAENAGLLRYTKGECAGK